MMTARHAVLADVESLCAIYNAGIAERIATFETEPRTPAQVAAWFDGIHPVVVVVEEERVIAFTAAFEYRPRDCYAGVAEFSVYAAPDARGRGAGRLALTALGNAAADAGFWKLVSRVFVENTASRRLLRTLGFREVGVYENHARLDGHWRNVIIVEKLLTIAPTEGVTE